jgi:hypothetical protein
MTGWLGALFGAEISFQELEILGGPPIPALSKISGSV